MKQDELLITPIAYIENDFKEKFGIPRQSGRAPAVHSKIVFLPEYSDADAFRALDGFSHLWLIFDFSKAHTARFSPTVRPPRLGGNERVGVFASRSPFRPNPLGLSVVRLEKIELENGKAVLTVSGADLLDGTPIFDVKPYLPFADAVENATSGYAGRTENYRLQVDFPMHLLEKIPLEKQEGLIECLADDPRPSYQDDPARIYGMRFGEFNVRFRVENGVLYVVEIA